VEARSIACISFEERKLAGAISGGMQVANEASDPSFFETNPLVMGRVEIIERELRAWAAAPITFSFNPEGTHLFSMMELRRSYVKRSVDFVDSIRSLIGQGRIVPATVIARALIETIAMGNLFLHDMAQLIIAGDRDRVEKRLRRYYAGTKGERVEPVHVMDAMRYLEKIDGEYVAYLDQKYGRVITRVMEGLKDAGSNNERNNSREMLSVMKNYNELSEVSHPNGTGTQFLYPDESNENALFSKALQRFRSAALRSIWQCHHLTSALEKTGDLPERYRSAFLHGR